MLVSLQAHINRFTLGARKTAKTSTTNNTRPESNATNYEPTSPKVSGPDTERQLRMHNSEHRSNRKQDELQSTAQQQSKPKNAARRRHVSFNESTETNIMANRSTGNVEQKKKSGAAQADARVEKKMTQNATTGSAVVTMRQSSGRAHQGIPTTRSVSKKRLGSTAQRNEAKR